MDKTMDVADYVIKLGNLKFKRGDCRHPISDLYLQKILYFLNVIRLLKTKGTKSLVDESFETWDYGPVLFSVYENYKIYKGNPITKILPVLIGYKVDNNGSIVGNYRYYNKRHILSVVPIIDDNIDKLLQYNPKALVNKSHEEIQWKTRTFRGQLYDNHLSYKWYSHDKKRQFWRYSPKEDEL